jgi:hypothetical protein
MTRAGHANMSTTQTYLHLAEGRVPGEARRLEQRFAAGTETSSRELGTELGTDLSEPQSTRRDVNGFVERKEQLADGGSDNQLF